VPGPLVVRGKESASAGVGQRAKGKSDPDEEVLPVSRRLLVTGIIVVVAAVVGVAIAFAATGGSGGSSNAGGATVSVK
jgi:hypothetical protein